MNASDRIKAKPGKSPGSVTCTAVAFHFSEKQLQHDLRWLERLLGSLKRECVEICQGVYILPADFGPEELERFKAHLRADEVHFAIFPVEIDRALITENLFAPEVALKKLTSWLMKQERRGKSGGVTRHFLQASRLVSAE